ncbi:MAG: nicotinate phosphoribosyltransferase [Candidatus Zixiibacteriota bacterium]|nr:MAG: nicotinate phosphoribosyltransferase [candidate division Zixibacteria bacterium]
MSDPADPRDPEPREGRSCLWHWVHRRGLALLTDWYEFTMMGGYHATGRGQERACFEYFFRDLPPHNGYAVLAGLEPFLEFYQHLAFTPEDIDYLRSANLFSPEFLQSLAEFRPACDVWAIPEGSAVFPYEPIVRVEGPLFEAQLLETFLLNALNYPTLVATKAARICQVAAPDPVVEFGLRRAQGPDGGLAGSRAAYLGGCVGTSNVLAGREYGIPVRGTQAHSWVMSFPSELEAFRAYVEVYPHNPILLVDTYNTLESGVPNALRVFTEMRQAGRPQRAAIRLDSGDLARLSKAAWEKFTQAGFEDPLIVASNELDEDLIADLKRQGARINSWGVGTNLITSKEAPALSGVYKLVALEREGRWEPRLKLSSNPAKTTDPGPKRPVRLYDDRDRPAGDLLLLPEETLDDSPPAGVDRQRFYRKYQWQHITRREELARRVFHHGRRVTPEAPLEEIRRHARSQVESLPDELKRLRNPEIYPVALSPRLAILKEDLLRRL